MQKVRRVYVLCAQLRQPEERDFQRVAPRAFIGKKMRSELIACFQNGAPPVRRQENIGTMPGRCGAESSGRMIIDWSIDAGGGGTRSVNVFFLNVGLRGDTKYACRAGEQNRRGGKDDNELAAELLWQSHSFSLTDHFALPRKAAGAAIPGTAGVLPASPLKATIYPASNGPAGGAFPGRVAAAMWPPWPFRAARPMAVGLSFTYRRSKRAT